MQHSGGLGTQLRLVTTQLDGDVQSLYDELGVPFRPRFFPVVQQLLNGGPTPVSALARTTGVSQPAATQTLREMARLGLVEHSPGEDARERRVRLTADGSRLAERLQPLWDAIGEAAAELDEELPCPLSDTLRAVVEALARKPFRERIQGKIKNG